VVRIDGLRRTTPRGSMGWGVMGRHSTHQRVQILPSAERGSAALNGIPVIVLEGWVRLNLVDAPHPQTMGWVEVHQRPEQLRRAMCGANQHKPSPASRLHGTFHYTH
jgi:hypothetical protein